ncbi:putative Cutinase transcription factor 1 beta [Glarea lozoyensis 74030]|uniref:Putative Cutinase transcription factor 1 beta n=1 Tax=Glarea lozoyensis (strain ATCC 74030 / MF5533) TaxID=1104152 RepID=H0ECA7_GLAL7|nr:putative Cutinase transcription factor 1 beta [Glarea lozoyensis 74030]
MSVRNALITAYLEYVHPYMPLIEVCETLRIIDDESGSSGKMSLFLFQAMMFAGTAFVDMDVLRRAGFTNRKAARKAFFQKARVLYDFDYEMDPLGMRRPTRVKEEDYDVPMLSEDDFETELLPLSNNIVPIEHTLLRDVAAQKELAQLCIAKAKLCLCVSHVLGAQYSVLVKHQGMQGQEGTTRSSVMLFPKKLDQTDEVRRCDLELKEWLAELPPACVYTEELGPGATLSALHRPQVLPNAPSDPSALSQLTQDNSRKRVREASKEITRISKQLHVTGLDRYLPTTGVTVLLPAIIIHLLDVKSPNEEARKAAMQGFVQCMQLLERLRENYSSADFASQFLEAAVKMANIDMTLMPRPQDKPLPTTEGVESAITTESINQLKGYVQGNRRTPPHDDTILFPQESHAKLDTIAALTPPDHQDALPPNLNFTNDLTLQFDPNANGACETDFFINFDATADSYMGDGVFGGESGLDLSFMNGGKEGWSRSVEIDGSSMSLSTIIVGVWVLFQRFNDMVWVRNIRIWNMIYRRLESGAGRLLDARLLNGKSGGV